MSLLNTKPEQASAVPPSGLPTSAQVVSPPQDGTASALPAHKARTFPPLRETEASPSRISRITSAARRTQPEPSVDLICANLAPGTSIELQEFTCLATRLQLQQNNPLLTSQAALTQLVSALNAGIKRMLPVSETLTPPTLELFETLLAIAKNPQLFSHLPHETVSATGDLLLEFESCAPHYFTRRLDHAAALWSKVRPTEDNMTPPVEPTELPCQTLSSTKPNSRSPAKKLGELLEDGKEQFFQLTLSQIEKALGLKSNGAGKQFACLRLQQMLRSGFYELADREGGQISQAVDLGPLASRLFESVIPTADRNCNYDLPLHFDAAGWQLHGQALRALMALAEVDLVATIDDATRHEIFTELAAVSIKFPAHERPLLEHVAHLFRK